MTGPEPKANTQPLLSRPDHPDLVAVSPASWCNDGPAHRFIGRLRVHIQHINIKLQRLPDDIARNFEQARADPAKAPVRINKQVRHVRLLALENQKANHSGLIFLGDQNVALNQCDTQAQMFLNRASTPRENLQTGAKNH